MDQCPPPFTFHSLSSGSTRAASAPPILVKCGLPDGGRSQNDSENGNFMSVSVNLPMSDTHAGGTSLNSEEVADPSVELTSSPAQHCGILQGYTTLCRDSVDTHSVRNSQMLMF